MAGLASQCWGAFYHNGEAQMRKALIALIAIVSVAGAGILFAAPKTTNSSTRIRRKHCHRYPEPHQTSQRPARSKLSRSLTEPLSLLSGCQQSLATAFQLLPLQRQPQRLLSQRSQTFGFMRGPTWNCLKFDTSWRSARS